MNTFAKVTTLAVVMVAGGLVATGSFARDIQLAPRETVDVFNDFADSLNERPEIEIRHTESVKPNYHINYAIDPHATVHNGVNGAVLSAKQMKLALKQGHLVLACSASSDDVLVANAGNIDLPAGTKLSWKVKASGDKGLARLTQGLQAGEKVRLADVLDAEVAKGTNCSAKVTGL